MSRLEMAGQCRGDVKTHEVYDSMGSLIARCSVYSTRTEYQVREVHLDVMNSLIVVASMAMRLRDALHLLVDDEDAYTSKLTR